MRSWYVDAPTKTRHRLVRVASSVAVAPVVGGAALLVGETDGMAAAFDYATDAQRVAVKVGGVTSSYGLDTFYTNTTTSPKLVYDVAGTLAWSSHNIFAQSETFDHAVWTKGNTTATVNVAAAPNGTMTADKIGRNLSTSGAFSLSSPNTTIINGETYTFRIWLKAGEVTWVSIDHLNTELNKTYFNLGAGTIGTVAAAHTATMTAAGGGYYCAITWTSTTANTLCTLMFQSADAQGSMTAGTIGDGLYVWGAQLNRGPVPTGYVATIAVSRYGIPIDYDPVTHVCKGMFGEPAATNLLSGSQTFTTGWNVGAGATKTLAQGTAPNGRNELVKYTMVAGVGEHWTFCASATSATKANSVYAKAGTLNWLCVSNIGPGTDGVYFNLATGAVGTQKGTSTGYMENCGGGIWRCVAIIPATTFATISFHAADNTTQLWSATGGETIFVWGAQSETATAIATSLVPTFAATATRTTDNITVLNANYPWNAAGPNSILFEAACKIPTAMGWVALHDGTDAERIVFDSSSATKIVRCNVIDASVVQTDMPSVTSTLVANTYYKMGAVIATDDCAITHSGTVINASYTDALASMPTVTTLQLGGSRTTPGRNVYIKNYKSVPRRMTNVELQTGTT